MRRPAPRIVQQRLRVRIIRLNAQHGLQFRNRFGLVAVAGEPDGKIIMGHCAVRVEFDCFSIMHHRSGVVVPLEKQMWGDEFGMCVDRFGIPWMVNISEPTE